LFSEAPADLGGVGEAEMVAQGPSNLNYKSTFEQFIDFWRYTSTKWPQERTNGSKNGPADLGSVGEAELVEAIAIPPVQVAHITNRLLGV